MQACVQPSTMQIPDRLPLAQSAFFATNASALKTYLSSSAKVRVKLGGTVFDFTNLMNVYVTTGDAWKLAGVSNAVVPPPITNTTVVTYDLYLYYSNGSGTSWVVLKSPSTSVWRNEGFGFFEDWKVGSWGTNGGASNIY